MVWAHVVDVWFIVSKFDKFDFSYKGFSNKRFHYDILCLIYGFYLLNLINLI